MGGAESEAKEAGRGRDVLVFMMVPSRTVTSLGNAGSLVSMTNHGPLQGDL
jgi:hypothetical protein